MTNRYQVITESAGTRMDGEKLFMVTIIDTECTIPWMRRTKHEELTQHEVNELENVIMLA